MYDGPGTAPASTSRPRDLSMFAALAPMIAVITFSAIALLVVKGHTSLGMSDRVALVVAALCEALVGAAALAAHLMCVPRNHRS